MAEESPLPPLSDTSPPSLKRRNTLTVSPSEIDQSSTLNQALIETQEPQFSQEQSPKKPRPDYNSFPLADFDRTKNGSAVDYAVGQVGIDGDSGLHGVELPKNNVTRVGFDEVGMSFPEIELVGDCVKDEIERISEVSGVEQVSADVAHDISKKMADFERNGEASGLETQGSGVVAMVGTDMADDVSKKMVEFDGNSEVSGLETVKKNVGFEGKGEIDEFLELKDEIGVMGKENSSEFVQLGSSSESQSGSTSEVTPLESKPKNRDENLQKGDVLTSLLMIEMIDDTVVLDFSDMENSIKPGLAGGDSNGGKRKIKYSRKAMEKLKFKNVKAQKKFWQEVYSGFAGNVKKEYDELASFKHHKHGGSHHHQAAGKRNYYDQVIPGESSSGKMSCDAEIISSTNFTFDGANNGEDGDDMVEEWGEDEKSDDEYQSIQRPAFSVEGEPDFESGSPEDGLEYLRRVRWEAAQIPKVKVAKLDRSKVKEQSVYMPNIPDIEKCPPHLAPLKQWEDEFIAEFSELRLAISCLEDSSDATSVDSDSIIFGHPERMRCSSKTLASLELPAGGPTLSSVLAMDPVTRVALLNRCIKKFESASSLSKDDCAWLFALCAVVDTPLDADTCASLRCLLRRCAKLRAEKRELDDEVVMLNVMATISGKFFRQLDN